MLLLMRIFAMTLACATCTAAPAVATPRLGEPRVVSVFDGKARVLESASDAAHRAMVVVESTPSGALRHVVLFRPADGRYRRFELPPPRDPIQQVRLATLEGGDGFAAWDDGDRIAVQRWRGDGRVDRPFVAIEAVRPVFAADPAAPNWGLGSDGSGTVAIAALRPGRGARVSVQAAIREPGVETFAPAVSVASLGVADVGVMAPLVERDGVVTIRWRGGAARRPAAGTPFAAPVASTWEETPGYEPVGEDRVAVDDLSAETMRGLPRGTRRVTLVGAEATGGPVAIGPALRNLCRMGAFGCADPHRFTWPGGTQRLAVLVSAPAPTRAWHWYVASPGRDASFVRPRLVSVNAGLAPLWGGTPGRVDFAGVDTDGAPGAERDGGRVFVVPYGSGPAIADRRLPRLMYGEHAHTDARAVYVPVWCNETCSLRVRVRVQRPGRRPGRWQPAAALDREGSYAVRMEPFQTAAIRVRARTATGTRLRLRVIVRDRVGRTVTSRATFRAAVAPDGAVAWCRARARGCG
ncbi:MAG: hypothetical protein ACSLFR_04010 [Solirubrobacteraceae bacterium]